MDYLFIYRMTHDTGFAPCVDNGLLSLACCKGGQLRRNKSVSSNLRYWIGSKRDGIDWETDNVYVVGVLKERFLYMAKIAKVVEMKDYFRVGSEYSGRLDQIYDYRDGMMIRNSFLRKKDVHTNQGAILRDIAGRYVLLSNDYIYLGRDSVPDHVIVSMAPRNRGTRLYSAENAQRIVRACEKYGYGITHKPTNPISDSPCSVICAVGNEKGVSDCVI